VSSVGVQLVWAVNLPNEVVSSGDHGCVGFAARTIMDFEFYCYEDFPKLSA
jgi:hypothetical protein